MATTRRAGERALPAILLHAALCAVLVVAVVVLASDAGSDSWSERFFLAFVGGDWTDGKQRELFQRRPFGPLRVVCSVASSYCSTWKGTFWRAAADSFRAVGSVTALTVLTVRPPLIVAVVLLRSLGRVIFQYVFVQGLFSAAAVSQIKAVGKKAVAWQRSLAPQQVALEVAVLLATGLLYEAWRLLQRRKYGKKAASWYRRKKRELVQSYNGIVQRISTVSVVLASMTPHAVFAAVAAFLHLVFPSVAAWIACETAARQFLSVWYPLVATILLLFDSWEAAQQGKERSDDKTTIRVGDENVNPNHKNTPGKSVRTRKSLYSPTVASEKKKRTRKQQQSSSSSQPFYPRTKPASTGSSRRQEGQRRSSLVGALRRTPVRGRSIPRRREAPGSNGTTEEIRGTEWSLADREEYWLRYWIIGASIAGAKRLLYLLPLVARVTKRYSTIGQIVQQAELVFWIWLNIVPSLTPAALQTDCPVEFLTTSVIGPSATVLQSGLSNAISAEMWEAWVVRNVQKILAPAVWSGIVTEEWAATTTQFSVRGRALVLPGIFAFSWPLASYSVAYVQYALPVAQSAHRSNHRDATHWLQYWVIHTMLTVCVSRMMGLLWWIPLSNAVLFGVYAYLALISGTAMNHIYVGIVQRELQAFGILPPGQSHDGEIPAVADTMSARAFTWILQYLPRADDDADESEDADESNVRVPEERSDGEECGASTDDTDPCPDEAEQLNGLVDDSGSDSQQIQAEVRRRRSPRLHVTRDDEATASPDATLRYGDRKQE